MQSCLGAGQGSRACHVSAYHRVLNAPLNLCCSILSEAIMLLFLASWGLHRIGSERTRLGIYCVA